MNHLDQAFEQAKNVYPNVWISGYELVSLPGLFDNDETEEANIPHTWQLVDAVAASFRTPEREGMLVLQERRPQSSAPSNH